MHPAAPDAGPPEQRAQDQALDAAAPAAGEPASRPSGTAEQQQQAMDAAPPAAVATSARPGGPGLLPPKLHIHALTFNMGNKAPATLPLALLGPLHQQAHLHIIATQESGALPDWEAALGRRLGPAGGGPARHPLPTLGPCGPAAPQPPLPLPPPLAIG